MANVLVEQQSLINIAEAIRTVNKTTTTYKPSEMAQAIIDTKDKSLIEMLESKTDLTNALACIPDLEIPVFKLNATSAQRLFYDSKIVTAPALDYSNIKNASYMFGNCIFLVTVPKMSLISLTSTANTAFQKCELLENISFEKNSIPLNISFANSPLLSNESLQSIIDGLAPSPPSAIHILTLHSETYAKLTDEQKQTISEKRWEVR